MQITKIYFDDYNASLKSTMMSICKRLKDQTFLPEQPAKDAYVRKRFSTRQYKSTTQEYQFIIDEISQKDISYIYLHQHKIIRLTQKVLNLWTCTRQHQELLEKMLCVFYQKVLIMSFTRSFLFDLYACFEYTSGKIGFSLTNCRRLYRIQIKDCQTDKLFCHFIQEQKTIRTRTSPYIVKDQNGNRVLLKQAIASTKEFNCVQWQQIFQITKITIKKQYLKEQQSKQQQAYLSRLHFEVAPILSCIGCTQFFFQNRNILHYHNQSEIVLMNKIKQIKKQTLINQIDLLRAKKGGVILFDCVKQYLDICPIGEKLSEKQKQQIKSNIQKLVNASANGLNNVSVSFIPVKEDPYKFNGVEKRDDAGKIINIERRFIPGQYVVRIKVGENHFRSTPHTCKTPLQGEPLLTIQQVTATSISNAKIEVIRQDYKYVSALVVKHCYHQAILDKLKKYNVIGRIQVRFQQHKMKGIANVALFHHNIKHEDLSNIIAYNNQFRFDNRYLMVIPITDYLRLIDRSQKNVMSRTDFNSLSEWIMKEFPNQRLKMWQYKNDCNESEYYLETDSKASTLFIYIVMSNFNQKSQFKVSKALQKMSLRQKQSVLKLYYSHNDVNILT